MQGGRWKSWKHRRCVLTEDALTYYDVKTNQEKNSVPLATATSAHLKKDNNKCFFINAMKRQYLFRCAATEEARAWVDAIQNVLDVLGGRNSPRAGSGSPLASGSSVGREKSYSDVLPPDFVTESSATGDELGRRGYLLVGSAGVFATREWRWVAIEDTVLSIYATPDSLLRGDAPLREVPLLGAEWWLSSGGTSDGFGADDDAGARASQVPVLSAGKKGTKRLSLLGAKEAARGITRAESESESSLVAEGGVSFDESNEAAALSPRGGGDGDGEGVLVLASLASSDGAAELKRWSNTVMMACSLARLCAQLSEEPGAASMTAGAAQCAVASAGSTLAAVSVLLFTVTFHANRAHNLTRSP